MGGKTCEGQPELPPSCAGALAKSLSSTQAWVVVHVLVEIGVVVVVVGVIVVLVLGTGSHVDCTSGPIFLVTGAMRPGACDLELDLDSTPPASGRTSELLDLSTRLLLVERETPDTMHLHDERQNLKNLARPCA